MTNLPRHAKNALSSALSTLLGRKNYARLARFLWMQSRLDSGSGDIATNGEKRLQSAFAQECERKGRVVIFDVGANVGDWTASLLEELATARIARERVELHLFEPAPAALEALKKRFTDHDGLHIRDLAVTDCTGLASFSILSELDGMNTLVPLTRQPARTIEVRQQTIDGYCDELGIEHIDFMKIDTEGNDLRVLRGASHMLASQRIGMIQFEYNYLWIAFRSFLRDVFELVEPHGYQLGKVTPRGVERYRSWHHELESFQLGNYLLWHGALPRSIDSIPWWNDDNGAP